MKKDEAKRLVVSLFRVWTVERGESVPYSSAEGGFLFYNWLQNNHPEVLDFGGDGDKWQVVHGWLLQAGLVRH